MSAASTTFDPVALRRAWAGSLVGTAVEAFDFFVYGTAAALVFGRLFFPALGAAAAVVASFATFSVAFVIRPLGSLLFGYIGDRFGRTRSLTSGLVVMGLATCAIGVLPTAAQIGVLAPIVLVVVRAVQGLAFGGEFGAAALLVAEHAPRRKRGLWCAAPQVGTGVGATLGSATFLVLGLTMSPESFLSWGWRVPFLISVVLVAVGLYIRLRVEETPVFVATRARHRPPRVPVSELLRHQWREVVAGAGSILMAPAYFYVGAVFLISYGTTQLGIPTTTMLTITVVGGTIQTLVVVLPAGLSDRFGRRRTMAIGNGLALVWALVMMPVLGSGGVLAVGVAVVVTQILPSATYGPAASMLPELFPTAYRTTGVGVAYNLGAVVGGAVPPLLAATLAGTLGGYAIGLMLAAYAAIALVCVLALRETRGSALGDEAPTAPPPTTIPVDVAEA